MKAVYLLFARAEEQKTVEVGAQGEKTFEEGIYIYVGSAMNSVESRLERQFSQDKNNHWHVDYLTSEVKAFDYFILPETSEYECVMAEILSEKYDSVDGFGSSDCNCNSHLFHVPEAGEDFSQLSEDS